MTTDQNRVSAAASFQTIETGLGCTALATGYDKRTGPVMTGVSLTFQTGCFTALVGPNGCGKSTLLRALMGFLPTWEGSVTLDGKAISSIPRRRLAKRVAFLPQDSHCPDYLTVAELLELGTHAHGAGFALAPRLSRARAENLLADVGLKGLGAAEVNRLSGGQRQRAFIAMILAQDADILLLDEPVNHLDIRYQYEVLRLARHLVHARGRTVIAVLHDLNLAGAFADRVALINAGRLVSHAPVSDVLTSEQIEAVWGIKGEIVNRNGRPQFLPDIQPVTEEKPSTKVAW